MSAYDSESEKSSIHQIAIEDFGDDVSIFERPEATSWRTTVIKMVIGVLFVGFVIGCIIYSVLNSDDEMKHEESEGFFPWDLSQHCTEGTLTYVNRTGTLNEYTTEQIGISWLQDASRKRIFHRIGIEEDEKDWEVSYYVFSNHSFVLKNHGGCARTTVGYNDFIEQMGLQEVPKQREESFKIGKEDADVYFYEGEPPFDVLIDGYHPALVRAYSNIKNNADYGWEYIFPQLQPGTMSGLFRKEYWFPEMAAGTTDYSVFDSVPDICFQKQDSSPPDVINTNHIRPPQKL